MTNMENKVYTIEEIKTIINSKRSELAEIYFVSDILLFGSYARGEQTSESDIDFLIETLKPISLFKFANLKEYFENLFGKKIDLGTKKSLKSFVKNTILKEALVV